MKHRYARLDIAIGLVALCYSAITVALYVAPLPSLSLWRGYYTLVASAGAAHLDARLAAAGFRALGPETASVSFTDFRGPVSVPLSELSGRLDPLDPRFDPYLRAAGALFRAGEREVRYLPADRSLVLTALRLSGGLNGSAWSLAELSTGRGALCLAALFGGAALFMLRSPRRAPLYLLGSVPWVPIAIAGGSAASTLSPMLYFAWCFASEALLVSAGLLGSFEGPDGDTLRRRLATGLGLLLAASAAATDPSWSAALAPAAADLVLWGGASALGARRRARGMHRLFAPLPLSGARERRRGVRASLTLLALAALLVGSAAAPAFFPERALPVPAPRALAGAPDWSWRSLERLARARRDAELPDASDFLAHQAYQAALAYGRPYRFPLPGERVTLPTYRRIGERIVEQRSTVLEFSHDWYRRQLSAPDGVARLFVAEARPTLTVLRPSAAGPLAEARVLLYALVCLCAFLPFLPSRGGLRSRASRAWKSIALRRRQNEA